MAFEHMGYRQLLLEFDGRIPRSTFWLRFAIPFGVLYLIFWMIDARAGTQDFGSGIGLWTGLFSLVVLFPQIAVSVKRLHDRNRSGWLLLLSLIPVINLWIALELGVLKGTEGANKYGPDPLAQEMESA